MHHHLNAYTPPRSRSRKEKKKMPAECSMEYKGSHLSDEAARIDFDPLVIVFFYYFLYLAIDLLFNASYFPFSLKHLVLIFLLQVDARI